MRHQTYFLLLIIFLLLFSELASGSSQNKEGRKAYLTVSIENLKMFPDSLAQSEVKTKIKEIFKNEGVSIIEIEKPDAYEEYKLYINISIEDSLIINAKGMSWDLALITVKYPRSSSPYENESEIYSAIKRYISKNIVGKS